MSPREDGWIDVSQIAPVHLELETTRSHALVGPYGAFVATMAPEQPSWGHEAATQSWPSRPVTRADRVMGALAEISIEVWKRLSLYSFLFMLFGNTLRCRGLSAGTNVACALLVLVGLAGVVACQRKP